MLKYFIILVMLITIQLGAFVSRDGDYSIAIPKSWEEKRDLMGTDVLALAPIKDQEDLFRENMNVITAKFDFPLSREDYYALNLKSMEQLLNDFDLEVSRDVTLGGIPARELIFTHQVGIVNVRVIQYLMLENQKAIVISFTSDTIEYPRIKEEFLNIASTFKYGAP